MSNRILTSILTVVLLMNTAILVYVPSAQRPAAASGPINYNDYDYYVQNLTVNMFVTSTGDIEFGEAMNFSFVRGIYSMAYREIPHEGFELLTRVEVINKTGTSLNIGAQYQFDWFKGKYLIRWPFNPKVAPSNTTFYIFYTATGAATSVAKDQLGIDWNIVGKGWSVPIKKVYVNLYLFQNFTKSPLFKYYPYNANISIAYVDGQKVTKISFNRTDISPGQTVRVIAYYPKNLEPVKSPERLLRENSLTIAAIIFLLIFFICLIFVLYRFISGRLVPRNLRPNVNIARDPMKLTTLIQGRFTPLAFYAGIVHLSQMGFASIEDDRESGEIWVKTREEGPDELSVPLMPQDGTILAALAEGPGNKPMHEIWNRVGRDMGDTMHRDLKNEGLFSKSGRYNISIFSIAVGAITAAVPMVILEVLILTMTFYAVVFGGILLGVTLGGASVLVILGFFTPRYTARGAHERSQQAANLESIAYHLDRTSRDTPDEVPAVFDKSAAVLTAAPVPMRGGFPTFLRKIGAQAPEIDYHHPWYECTAAPEEAPKGRTFGTFALAYADTLDRIPLYFRGRLGERAEERPPVEGTGMDGDIHGAPPMDDVTAYHDLDAPTPVAPPSEPTEFEVIHERPEGTPKKGGAPRPTRPKVRPPAKKEGI
jgi:hypothetical protein